MKRHNVTPVQWAGGKAFQLHNINKALPARFSSIIEPFAGSAALSMALLDEGRGGLESVWLNDSNRPLIDFWCLLRDNPNMMYRRLMKFRNHFGLGTENLYEIAKEAMNDEKSNERKRGVAFYIYNRSCVPARHGDKNFAHPLISKKGLRADHIESLRYYGRLLNGAKITCGDYQQVKGEDGALMFCDPPYMIGDKKIKGMYGAAFDHARFAKWCESVRDDCQMLITLDNNPVHIERFKAWNIYQYPVFYRLSKKWETELIITNYPVPFASVWERESGWKIIQETTGSPQEATNDSGAGGIGAAA